MSAAKDGARVSKTGNGKVKSGDSGDAAQRRTRDVTNSSGGATKRWVPSTPPARPEVHYNTFNAPFFSTVRSPRRQYFTIHPEWASENVGAAATNSSSNSSNSTGRPACWANTFPPPHTGRRCRSAPPGMRSRNPITWENWYDSQWQR